MKQITKVFSVGLAVLMLAGSLNCGVEAFAYAPEYGITYQRGQYRRTYTGKKMSYPKMSVIVSRHGKTSTVKNAKLISVSGNKSGKTINGYTTKYTYKLPNGKKITASKNWWIIPKKYDKNKIEVIDPAPCWVSKGRVLIILYNLKNKGCTSYHVSAYNKSGKFLGEGIGTCERKAVTPCYFGEPMTFKIVTCKEVTKKTGNKVSTIHIKSDPVIIKTTVNLRAPNFEVRSTDRKNSTLVICEVCRQEYSMPSMIQIQASKNKKSVMITISEEQHKKLHKSTKSNTIPLCKYPKGKNATVRGRYVVYSKYQKKYIYGKWAKIQ